MEITVKYKNGTKVVVRGLVDTLKTHDAILCREIEHPALGSRPWDGLGGSYITRWVDRSGKFKSVAFFWPTYEGPGNGDGPPSFFATF